MRLDEPVKLDTAAKLAGVLPGTLAAWRSRERVPGTSYTMADVMSLAAGTRLMEFGMDVRAAAEIGWGLRATWVEILQHDASVYLMVKPTGEFPPFEYGCHTSDQIIAYYEPAALIVNLSTVAREVLAGAVAFEKAQSR